MVLLMKRVVNATIFVYNEILETFKPTPEKSYYLFNLRDFSRVISGIQMVPIERL